MYIRHLKKAAVICLAAVMILSFAACGLHSKKGEATEESTEVKQSNPEYVKEGVVLPKNFGNMVYPMEAVLLEHYTKELPYYTQDSSDDEATSFWFSMAVLTSQMNHFVKDVAVEKKSHYLYLDEDTMNMYVTAMYDAFGKGDLEFPPLDDDEIFAVYDEEKDIYGFREGEIEDLEPYITDCKKSGDSYVLTMQLKNKDSAKIAASSDIVIVPSSYEGDDNAFAYSIKKFTPYDSDDMADFSEKDSSDKKKDKDASDEDSDSISEDEALELAKEYIGEDLDCSFKEIINVGDDEVYDFEIEGEGTIYTDVLVWVNGRNVVAAYKNEDEEHSWTFDQ